MRVDIRVPTDRSFGWTFAIVSGALSSWMFWKASPHAAPVLGLCALFVLATIARPTILRPLNIAWAYVGLALHKIVSPLALGAIFLVALVPAGLVFRLIGRDPLKRTFEPSQPSYWVDRTPPGPDGKTLPRQF